MTVETATTDRALMATHPTVDRLEVLCQKMKPSAATCKTLNGFSDAEHNPLLHNPLLGTGLSRTLTMQSLSASSTSSEESGQYENALSSCVDFNTFGVDLRKATYHDTETPMFGQELRRVMEQYLRQARLRREKARNGTKLNVHASIAGSVGVPYVRLRQERPFLFDVHTHPLHEVLCKALNIGDLSRLHEEYSLVETMRPLNSRDGRRDFHLAYERFVTSFCIPLLHSIAMSKSLLHGPDTGSFIAYRYQAFPRIRIRRPGEVSSGPSCGTARGHSMGYLHFHVPLTPSIGTNALYAETHPGKEDWHALSAKSVGLGYIFDGARCLHFDMENTTDQTAVSLEFVVALYGENSQSHYVDGEALCSPTFLEDKFSNGDAGFYDEAIIDMSGGCPSWQIVAKKNGSQLWDPDCRLGFPFE